MLKRVLFASALVASLIVPAVVSAAPAGTMPTLASKPGVKCKLPRVCINPPISRIAR